MLIRLIGAMGARPIALRSIAVRLIVSSSIAVSSIAISSIVGLLSVPVELPGSVTSVALAAPKTPKVTKISQTQVRQILDAMQTAANRRNVDGILKFVAPKATVEMVFQSPITGQQKTRLTREEYRRYLVRGYEVMQSYSGRYTNLAIKIAPNGKTAIATCQVLEETTLKEQPLQLSAVSNETLKFEIIGNQILITSIQATTQMQVKQR